MTNITSTVRWKSYTGNGSAGPFEFAFQINAYTEVKVYVDSTLKTAGSHYNVENSSSETSKINTDGTGRVRFTSSNFPTSSQTITIVSNVPLSRTSVYSTGGPFTASALETDFETSLMVQQQIDKKLDRALVAPEYDIDTISMTLPAKDTRKGTVLGFNATTGNPEAGPTIANVNSLSAITTNINTVAGISSNVTTVAGISSNVTTVAGIASNVTSVAGVASLITSDFVTDLNLLATSAIVEDLNLLATSDVISDLNTLATSDFVSDLNAVEGIKANITTVADNITNVSNFANRYRIASSDPSDSLDEGDLLYNSTSNTLKYYNGSAWTAVQLTSGISSGNVATFTSGVADNDFLRVDGTSIEGRSASEVLSDIGGQASLTFGISNTNAVKVDSSSVADDEYARFTANGLESRSTSEVLSDIGGQASLTFGISNTNAVKIDSSSVADDEYARFTANGLESRSASEVLTDIGVNSTADELNLLDGSAKSTSSITVADSDAIIIIDGTTTKQIPASDIKTYVGAGTGSMDLNGEELILDADADTSITADTDDQIDIKVAGSDKLKIDASSHLVTTTAGANNLVLGVNAGNSILSGGNYNVCIGDEAGTALTTGDKNVAVGYKALNSEDANGVNIAVGYYALKTLNAGANAYNTAVGYQAGEDLTTGANNTIVGAFCGDALTDADYNVVVGRSSLGADTKGSKSTAIGYGTLQAQNFTTSTDAYNTVVGYQAGNDISTGVKNTIVGSLSGDTQTTANRCTIIGFNNDPSSNSTFDEIVMGNGVTGSGDSSFTFGTDDADSAIANGSDSISMPSDERYKTEITTSTAGLGFINDLRPVTFKWKMEKDVPADHRAYVEGSEKRVMNAKDELYHGFIAQEVKAAVDNHAEVKNYDDLWSENTDGRQRLGVTKLIPMLTKAIQELSEKNDALEARVKTLEGS